MLPSWRDNPTSPLSGYEFFHRLSQYFLGNKDYKYCKITTSPVNNISMTVFTVYGEPERRDFSVVLYIIPETGEGFYRLLLDRNGVFQKIF